MLALHFLIYIYVSVTARRGVKRRWNSEEDGFFMDFFKQEIKAKKMPTGGKIHQAVKTLKDRTVAQIRTRIYNIIKDKQKMKKKKF